MNRNNKFSIEEVEKILSDFGYSLVDEYVNNRAPVKCIGKQDYCYMIRIDNLLYGYKPSLWGRTNYGNLEHNINVWLGDKEIRFVDYVVRGSKKKTYAEIVLRCSCGANFSVSLTKLVNNHYKFLMCKDCLKKEHPSGIKKTTQEYLKEFDKYGYAVISHPHRISLKTRVEVVDKDGFKGTTCLDSCRINKHFSTFDIRSNRENFMYNANLLLRENGVDTICNGFIDKEHLSFTCGCGKELILNQKQFRSGKYRCDSCTKIKSGLEIKVAQYLTENKVLYIEQYKYEDCRDKLPLPFDFYLTQYNTLLEVDGRQHFVPCMGGNEDFNTRKKHDNIKDEYCSSHDIRLIRIPYFDFENENWKKYLIDFIKE